MLAGTVFAAYNNNIMSEAEPLGGGTPESSSGIGSDGFESGHYGEGSAHPDDRASNEGDHLSIGSSYYGLPRRRPLPDIAANPGGIIEALAPPDYE